MIEISIEKSSYTRGEASVWGLVVVIGRSINSNWFSLTITCHVHQVLTPGNPWGGSNVLDCKALKTRFWYLVPVTTLTEETKGSPDMDCCLYCCTEPVCRSDPIEIIEDYSPEEHASTDVARLSALKNDEGWYHRNSNKKALSINHIGLKRLSEMLNSESFLFSELETVDVWLGTLQNDLEGTAGQMGFHSFFLRHRQTLQILTVDTFGVHEDVLMSTAQIIDASRCLANLKAVFFRSRRISSEVLGTFESASQLRYLNIYFLTLDDEIKLCAPNLEYLTMIQTELTPLKVDLSSIRNLIKVEFAVWGRASQHLILSSNNRKLRWLQVCGHFKVDGDVSKVVVLGVTLGTNELISALMKRCKSALRELKLACCDDLEVDASELIRVVHIRRMKNFSLFTSESRLLDALLIESVEFANPATPVHATRVCIVGHTPVDKIFDGTTHLAFISHRSKSGNPSMQTIVNCNGRNLESLLLIPMVVTYLPLLPNIKFLFLPNLEDLIAHAAASQDHLEQVSAFFNENHQWEDFVREAVCSNLVRIDASCLRREETAWRLWRRYGGFSSNLWSDSTHI